MMYLYKAEHDAMNSYIVEDTTTGKGITVDWNLSEEEINDLVETFENGTLDYEANGNEWTENWKETEVDSRYGYTLIGVYNNE